LLHFHHTENQNLAQTKLRITQVAT